MSLRTTPEILRTWFDEGVKKKATHMVVVCDTFDHNDFPVYVMPGQDAREFAKDYNDEKKMSRVMEVYNLSADREEQLAASRTFNYGDSPSPSPSEKAKKLSLSPAARLRRHMRQRGHSQFNMKMAKDACSWMAARQAFGAPEASSSVGTDVLAARPLAPRQAYSPPVPPTAESKDDGIVDVLNASEQLVAGVRRFAAMVVECQKNVRTKVEASATENKRRR